MARKSSKRLFEYYGGNSGSFYIRLHQFHWYVKGSILHFMKTE